MDWTATMLAAASAHADVAYPLDGEDLIPLLTGRSAPPADRPLFWRSAARDAARLGRWKYLRDAQGEYLFDLSVDPGEHADLRARHRDIFDELRARFAAWNSQMLPRRVS